MKHTIIIAEAGVNHNGDMGLACQLIDCAAKAGADYVKFQTFKADKLVSKQARRADYQNQNINNADDSQFNMLKKLELMEDDHLLLIEHCNRKGIKFLSTPFDDESIRLLSRHSVRIGKIPSGEITNKPYLAAMAEHFPEIILSSGMADMSEVKDAIGVLLDNGTSLENITVLHCNTEYPTPMQDVNLLAMHTIGKSLNVRVGYSDHTLGIEVPIAATALGAVLIEKHITLDRSMKGPDHAASLEPSELKAMVTAIRNIDLAISGTGAKEPSPSELKNKIVARKSIHLKYALKKSHKLTANDLEMKRPGDGISPMRMQEVIGKCILTDLPKEHKLTFDNINDCE